MEHRGVGGSAWDYLCVSHHELEPPPRNSILSPLIGVNVEIFCVLKGSTFDNVKE